MSPSRSRAAAPSSWRRRSARCCARGDKLLVLINGAYGERIAAIAGRLGRPIRTLRWGEDQAVDPAVVGQALIADPALTHVAVVHCETTSGVLNPLEAVADVAARHERAP